jgi:nitrogen regulatory protein P-II 1
MKAIFLIMAESEHLEGVVNAWRKIGLTGVTILDSFGGGEALHKHEAEDSLPVFGSVMGYLRSRRPKSYTVISVVEEDRMVDEAIRAVESVMGDLTERGKGLLFVVPLDKVKGYRGGAG